MTQQKKSYLLPIAMMFALFAMISFVTGLPAPFGVIVQNQFGATNFQATLGFAANFIAYFFMGIPSGMLLQKIGYKKTALSSSVSQALECKRLLRRQDRITVSPFIFPEHLFPVSPCVC